MSPRVSSASRVTVVSAVGTIARAAPRALVGREAALGLGFSGSVLVPEQIRHVGVKAECAARVIAARCAGAWPARIAARGR
jgi:hypothetical protein